MPEWNTKNVRNKDFICGHCSKSVASVCGWDSTNEIYSVYIRICPSCGRPNYFEFGNHSPSPKPGEQISNLPDKVNSLYNEVRNAIQANAYTCALMGARKLLMNVAVDRGAKPGDSFLSYIDYLESNGEIPAKCKPWIDHIRKQGNIATHDIPDATIETLSEMLDFIMMLLRIVYDFPSRLPS